MDEKQADAGDSRATGAKASVLRKRLGIVVIGLTVALSVLLQFWDTPIAAMQTGKAADAYRRAGWPWEAKDLAPEPPVAEAENAAPLLREAAAALPKADDPKPAIDWSKPTGTDLDKLEANLAPFKVALKLVHEAAACPRLDFKWDWDEGPALITPETAPLRKILRALVTRAELEAFTRRPGACAADLGDAIKVAELCESEPDWFCLGFGLNCQNAVLVAVSVAAYCVRTDPAALDRLEGIVNRIRIPRTDLALRGVVYHNLAMLRNYDSFGPSIDNSEVVVEFDHSRIVRTGLPAGFTARAYATRFFQAWAEAKRVIDANAGDPARYWPEIGRISEAAYNHLGSSYRLMAILVPIMADSKKLKELPASIAVTVALLELLQFKAKHHAWPASLAELPGTWTDPYTGTPLHYVVNGNAVRIYSLGPDGVDHGGRSRSEATETVHGYNIVAACPPLAPRAAR